MEAVDWQSKPEPWQSIGLRFREELRTGVLPQPKEPAADCVRRLRHAREWTQLDLAAAAGVPRIAVHYAEQGLSIFPERCAAIAAALGVSVTDIWHEGE